MWAALIPAALNLLGGSEDEDTPSNVKTWDVPTNVGYSDLLFKNRFNSQEDYDKWISETLGTNSLSLGGA
jgi:hypothetical protein